MRARSRRNPAAFFGFATLAIVTACIAVRYTAMFAADPEVAAWGITFDLTISVPLLYWFFLVRTGIARPLTIGPVFLLGTLATMVLLPRAQQELARQLATVVGPCAAMLIAVSVVTRTIALQKQRVGSGDVTDRISAVARVLVGEGRVADVVASEVAIIYYAFFGWRHQPEKRKYSMSFHERNGWGTVVAGIVLLIAVEGLGMHLLLARWSSVAAWAWTILDLWAVIWFLGDYQALRLRRTWLDDQALHLQHGLRWSVTIPRERIVTVRRVRQESDWKRKDVLKVAMLDDPRWLITLDRPMVARGLAGMRKEIIAVALLPDDDDCIAQWTLLPSASPR